MPITRHGPVHNMDTQEPLQVQGQRFTRAQAHRLLKLRNVPHDANAPLENLVYAMRMHNVAFEMPPPGPIDIPEEEDVELARDGYPKNMGKLKTLCKKRGFKLSRTVTRAEMVQMLNG